MIPGNSSWRPWTSSERGWAKLPLIYGHHHFISGLQSRRKTRARYPRVRLQPRFCRGAAATFGSSLAVWYFFRIFNRLELKPDRPDDSPRRKAVTPTARIAALRSKALATCLALALGLTAAGA